MKYNEYLSLSEHVRLKYWKRQLNYKNEDLASMFNVERHSITRWLNDHCKIPEDIICRVDFESKEFFEE